MSGIPYLPGLDGLRALSVIAVLLFHAGVAWTPAGFLGVDVFFVISGYLITALLLFEWGRTGRVGLRGFWMRRARRLLPALYALLVVVALYCAVVLREELGDLRGDVVAALTYVTNWFLVAKDESYFEALGRPSLLKHLWSLAIEEQFYLLWPLLFGVGMRRLGGHPLRLAKWAIGGAAASTLLMAVLHDPVGDPSRVYYGTDTRAAGLLLGAALACVWAPWRLTRRTGPGAGLVLDAAGVAALGALVWLVHGADQYGTFLYRGGFALVALVTAVLVAVVVHPAARLPRVLGVAPLRWIGLRSYGIYLWHWPVYMVTRPRLDIPLTGTPLLVLRLSLTVLLAELSFRYVETPVRSGAFGAAVRAFLERPAAWRTRLGPRPALAGAAVLALVGVLATQLAGARVTAPFGATTSDTVPVVRTQRVGEGGLPVPLVVVGDSVGMTLVLNAPPSVAASFTLTDGSVEGCGVVQGTISSARGIRRDLARECEGWEEQWAADVRATAAPLALVTVGAWEVFDLEVDGEDLPFGSAGWDEHFRTHLRRGIAAVRAEGAQVALLEVPCYRPIDGGGLQALPERGDDGRTRHLNELLRAVAADDPEHVFTVMSPAEYCADESLARDVGHRWDGVHYYKPGAELVWRTITPQLLAIPRS